MSMDWFSRSDRDKTTPGIWWVCVFIFGISACVYSCCFNTLVYRTTHCAACRYMRCLRWSRCAEAPRSGVCPCRRRPQGLCRRAAICMDSPSHRRVRSRSEETGEALHLSFVFIYLFIYIDILLLCIFYLAVTLSFYYLFSSFFWPFGGFIWQDRWIVAGKGEKERGQCPAMGHSLELNPGCHCTDTAAVHGVHTLPIMLLGRSDLICSDLNFTLSCSVWPNCCLLSNVLFF